MGKVKVTQVQAEWLDKYKTEEEIDYAINIQPYKKRPDSPIIHWEPSDVAKALWIGYEVEEKFKIGDWVTPVEGDLNLPDGMIAAQIVKIVNNQFVYWNDTNNRNIQRFRHATPEEIKAEQERRVWAGIGREVNEVREGDCIASGGKYYKVFENMGTDIYNNHISRSYAISLIKDGYYSCGFYPAESFISFGGEEE